MASVGYTPTDPEIEDKNNRGRSNPWSTSGFSGSSTGGRSSSYSSNSGGDRQANALDPVRQRERNPNRDSAGEPGEDKPGRANSAGEGSGGASTPTSGDGAPEPGSGLKNREENPDDTVGQGYNDGSSNQTGRRRGSFRIPLTRRRVVIGAGALAGAGATGAVVFFMLIPLKIETAVKDLENKAQSAVQSDVQQENRTLFEKYVVNRVLPGYQKCGSTRDRHCGAIKFTGSDNPVTGLYNVWAQNKFETRLAEDYGIEFKYHPRSGTWVILAPGLGTNGEDIGAAGNNLDNVFSKRATARKAIGDAVDQALVGESRWKSSYTRYKLGRLLEEKYGLPRCVVICHATDPLHNFVKTQKTAMTIYLTQRVIIPRTQTLGIALECLMTNCDPTKTQPNGDPSSPAEGGEPKDPEVDKPVSDGVKALAAKYEIKEGDKVTLKAIQDAVDGINEKGLQKWLISAGLQKFGATTATADIAADAIPIVGQVNLAAQTVSAADNSSTSLKKLRYVVNSYAYVNTLGTFRVLASEIHDGHVSATTVGSAVKALGSDDILNKNSPGAPAEAAPIWQRVISGMKKVSRGAGTSKNYKCNSGKNVSSTSLVCPEASLGGGNSFANTIHDFLNLPGVDVVTTIANLWTSTVGKVFNIAGGVLGDAINILVKPFDLACKAPVIGTIATGGYCEAKKLAAKASGLIITGVTEWLIPNPLEKMDGAHTITAMAGGAAVEAADAGTQIGGHDLTSQQVATLSGQMEAQDQRQFEHQSFFARMFSTDTQYSLVSRMAMAMPFDFQSSAQDGVATLVSNPFGMLLHGFGSIFAKASADDNGSSTADLFDAYTVKAKGYTTQEVAAIKDSEAYWTKNCNGDESQGFQNGNAYNVNASQHTDPDTGMPDYQTSNPCKLIQTSVCSLGVVEDTSLCTQDDVADINGGSGSSGSTGAVGGITNPFPGGWTPSRLDMGYDGTFKGQIVAPFDGTITFAGLLTGWDGSSGVVIQAHNDVGLPGGQKSLYFYEGVGPITSLLGKDVTAGTPIANAVVNPYNSTVGNIEWGVSQDVKTTGQQVDTYAVALGGGIKCTPTAQSKQMVLDFYKWAQQSAQVKGNTTSQACAGAP